MMVDRVARNGLQISQVLFDFIETQALPETGVSSDDFWAGMAVLAHDLGPKNRALLAVRADIQGKINQWHIDQRGKAHDFANYTKFLNDIGYIVPQPDPFEITTQNTDPEIAQIAGPQLVVPITNARFALNAANARWGSLYDALYGTDAMGDLPPKGGFNAARGAQVVAWAKAHLDATIPLSGGNWGDVTEISVQSDMVHFNGAIALQDPSQFVGHSVERGEYLFAKNGLHLRVLIDPSTPVGSSDPAGISDVILESALSTIMDCEDSVACVDADDKVLAYSNWLGLMKQNLTAQVSKAGSSFTRRMNDDLRFTGANGAEMTLKGRSLMLVRNVGHLMTNPAILDKDGNEIGEGLMDALCTVMIAMHDIQQTGGNSVFGSVYVVKPKMHGPDEVAFADEIFTKVEDILGLPNGTVKIGIMDEERRTSVNLAACIKAAQNRVAFINTGFLDRTGDEIHTSMEAGPMIPKGQMKMTPWINAYEDRNVDIGLMCGLQGRAQIGKGMWAMPDLMGEMLVQKMGHPKSGANCAWVPSPTAATLHATHYHQFDVMARQQELKAAGPRWGLDEILTIPTAGQHNWSDAEIQTEMENNAQGILGYVVRWIDHGVGCSKVPDIHNVGLMEDRATCRISSQALANWLHHGIVSHDQVMTAMQKMAHVVDGQNANDAGYTPMAPNFDGIAFKAACDLVFKGAEQPSGYTEPVLHKYRLELKAG